MKLRDVLRGFDESWIQGLPRERLEANVIGVTSDSREMKPGFVYVAVRGGTQDGHRFIPEVAGKNPVLIVGEDAAQIAGFVRVPDSRWALARIAANFYGNPSETLRMIGVTGTSGKTTTTYLIEAVLKAAGHQVGVLGTVSFRIGSKVLPSTHTTPGSVELQRLLAEMKAEGCTAVVMEVSSHALKQQRCACLAFDGMVFTNLTPEHLDFHPDMEDYFQSKRLLFTEYAKTAVAVSKKPVAAVNSADPYGKRLIDELRAEAGSPIRLQTYGMLPEDDFSGSDVKISLEGIQGKVSGVEIRSRLMGRFNAFNVLAAVAVCRGIGVMPDAVARGISSLQTVPGRLEKVENARGVHVLVDYAHKPDALENVLRTLNDCKTPQQRIITVVGCGGDRDRSKRPVMGKLAVTLSNHAIITSDNPRTEEPGAIIAEILAGLEGMKGFTEFTVEPDRKAAIFKAVAMAKKGDIILIAGKGHEDYQIIADPARPGATKKIHFDDREIARDALI